MCVSCHHHFARFTLHKDNTVVTTFDKWKFDCFTLNSIFNFFFNFFLAISFLYHFTPRSLLFSHTSLFFFNDKFLLAGIISTHFLICQKQYHHEYILLSQLWELKNTRVRIYILQETVMYTIHTQYINRYRLFRESI